MQQTDRGQVHRQSVNCRLVIYGAVGAGSVEWEGMFRKTPPLTPKNSESVSHRSTPWHAVSVVPGRWCCEAADSLRNVRFLSADAPQLPLPQCASRESCSCAYKHHRDRRGQPRRRDELLGMPRAGYVPNERRMARGRRWDD